MNALMTIHSIQRPGGISDQRHRNINDDAGKRYLDVAQTVLTVGIRQCSVPFMILHGDPTRDTASLCLQLPFPDTSISIATVRRRLTVFAV